MVGTKSCVGTLSSTTVAARPQRERIRTGRTTFRFFPSPTAALRRPAARSTRCCWPGIVDQQPSPGCCRSRPSKTPRYGGACRRTPTVLLSRARRSTSPMTYTFTRPPPRPNSCCHDRNRECGGDDEGGTWRGMDRHSRIEWSQGCCRPRVHQDEVAREVGVGARKLQRRCFDSPDCTEIRVPSTRERSRKLLSIAEK